MLLQLIKCLFNMIALGIGQWVEMRQVSPPRVRRNYRQRPFAGQPAAQPVTVIGRISYDFTGRRYMGC